MKIYKIKHKTEGWTGTIEFDEPDTSSWSSHHCSGNIHFYLDQDCHDENGKYHEDPSIESFDEIEFLEELKGGE